MEESNFDRLLLRYVTGEATEEEKKKLDAWLDSVADEPAGKQHLSADDEEELFRRITDNLFSAEDVVELKSKLGPSPGYALPRKGRSRNLWGWAIAASVSLIVIVSYLFDMHNGGDMYNFRTAERLEKAVLEDGSVISYKSNAHVSWKLNEGERSASLTGEAFFEIASNPEKPFIIHCEGVVVKVLGTSFRIVSHDKNDFTLHVIHGRVEIAAEGEEAGVVVSANEMAVLRGGSFHKLAFDPGNMPEVTSGVDYFMRFRGDSFREVLTRLEGKYDVTFNLEKSGAARCRISVDLTGYSLDEALLVLSDILDIDYHRDGKNISVSGRGC